MKLNPRYSRETNFPIGYLYSHERYTRPYSTGQIRTTKSQNM